MGLKRLSTKSGYFAGFFFNPCLTTKIYIYYFFFYFSHLCMLLSVHVKTFSVSCMQDFFTGWTSSPNLCKSTKGCGVSRPFGHYRHWCRFSPLQAFPTNSFMYGNLSNPILLNRYNDLNIYTMLDLFRSLHINVRNT